MKNLVFVILGLTALWGVPLATAQESDHREGGLTGTGITGIITELGSFHVNGQRITYPQGATAHSALGQIDASDLRLGDTVAAQVLWVEDVWVAQEIRHIHPIVGPIGALDDTSVIIMGTVVDISHTQIPEVATGDWLAVSGLWRANEIVASRVVPVPPQPQAHILGSYFPPQGDTPLTMGGSVIAGITPQHAMKGEVLRVSGQPLSQGINAQTLSLGVFDNPVGLLLAQGYLSHPDSEGYYTILGSGLSAHTDRPEMLSSSATAIFCGNDGNLIANGLLGAGELMTNMRRLGCME